MSEFLWSLYGLTRAYPGVFVGAFLVGFVLAVTGALRLLERPLDLAPLTDEEEAE